MKVDFSRAEGQTQSSHGRFTSRETFSFWKQEVWDRTNDGGEWNREKAIDGLMEMQAGPEAFMF